MRARVAYAVLTLCAPFAVLALGDHGLRWDLSVLAVVTLAGVGVGAVERQTPFELRWNAPLGDTAVDVLHLLLSTIGVVALFELAAPLLPSLGVWPSSWPFAVQAVVALLVAELGAYWAHRWMHAVRPLWAVHRIHHSARRLHSLNSSRNHPLDSLALLVVAGVPLLLLGAPARVLAAVAGLALVHLQFQHANAVLKLGPLNWVLAGPEPHRWHHSRVPAEANGNYGHVLLIWDVLFGTRVAPEGRSAPAEVGLFGQDALPERYVDHLAAPFR